MNLNTPKRTYARLPNGRFTTAFVNTPDYDELLRQLVAMHPRTPYTFAHERNAKPSIWAEVKRQVRSFFSSDGGGC